MPDEEWLAARFEERRPRLRGVAYRMLGSVADADDAVQEAWLRLHRTDAEGIDDLTSWLTTVVARICLNVLRSRRARGERPLELGPVEPVIDRPGTTDPEHEALLADSVGLALMVVLDVMTPAERLAFVLHDVFAVPYDEIAPMVDRTPEAARQLASRARRRVQGEAPVPEGRLGAQRDVVDAFFAAARSGDLERLVAVLHPEVVLRVDAGPPESRRVQGARAVAGRASRFADPSRQVVPATVNGAAGAVIVTAGRPFSVMGFTVVDGRVAAIDVLTDPAVLERVDLVALGGAP